MGGGISAVGQAGEVGDKGRNRQTATEVVGADGDRQKRNVRPASCEDNEKQIGGGDQDGPQQQTAEDAETGHQQTAGEGAQEGHEKAENLGDVADLALAEAQVDVKGVGHHPHGDVANAVGPDEQQDDQGKAAVSGKEIYKGASHRTVEPAAAFLCRRDRAGTCGPLRLADDQGGGDTDKTQCGHGKIGIGPGEPTGDVERPGTRRQQGQPVAEDIGGGHGTLQQAIHRLDAVGIDRHVLGSRTEGHQKRKTDQARQGALRVAERDAGEAHDDAALCKKHPRAAAPQKPVQQG